MESQINIRDNAMHAQAILDDLLKWQKEQKKKDDALREQARSDAAAPSQAPLVPMPPVSPISGRQAEELPPVALENERGQSGTGLNGSAALASAARKLAQPHNRHPAAHTFDRAARRWEAFDADRALAQLSDEEAEAAANSGQGLSKPKAAAASQPGTSSAEDTLGLSAVSTRRLNGAGPAAAGNAQEQTKKQPPPIRRVRQEPGGAEEWRERGNVAFKRGDWAGAREAYSRSIEATPTAAAYANRAMTALKAGDASAAEADATAALALDAEYLKAWQRRAAARARLGRLLDAIDDLEAALRLEPGSKALAAERRAIVAQHAAAEKLPALPRVPLSLQRSPSAAEAPLKHVDTGLGSEPVQPAARMGTPEGHANDGKTAAAQPSMAAQQPFAARPESAAVPGSDAGKDDAAAQPQKHEQPPPPASNSTAGLTVARQPDQAGAGAQQGTEAKGQGSGIFGSALAGKAPVKRSSAEDGASQQQAPGGVDRDATAAALAEVGVQLGPPTPQELARSQPAAAAPAAVDGPGSAAAANGISREGAHAASEHANGTLDGTAAALAAAKRALAAKSAASAKPPRSGMEFETVWKSLGADLQGRASYLALLNPPSLPRLFRHALTAPLLRSVLSTLLTASLTNSDSSAHATAMLAALPAVPRFDMTLMCLSASQRAELAAQWDAAVRALAPGAAARLQELRRAYRL